MTYVSTSLIPGADLSGFAAVNDALPEAPPEGLVARYAGQTSDGLAITTVWASKALADRFGAEHLGPAVRRIHGDAPAGTSTIAFDATDEMVVR